MTASLQLRTSTIDDAELVARMHAASRQSAYRGILTDRYLDDEMLPESLGLWPGKLQNVKAGAGEVLIAERDGVPLGFICMLVPDENRSVFVDNLHTLPEHKGSGAGTLMLEAARRWGEARGADRMHLVVLQANVAAIGFYESRGWHCAGSLRDTMGGTDVLVWVYELRFEPVS